jgi:hypothetical protein
MGAGPRREEVDLRLAGSDLALDGAAGREGDGGGYFLTLAGERPGQEAKVEGDTRELPHYFASLRDFVAV